MSGLYGNRFKPDTIIEEQVLTEMGFSKKDLQDPKTIEKILKRTDKYKSIYDSLLPLIALLGSVICICTFCIGFVIFIPLYNKLYEHVKAYPVKKNNKEMERLKKKCLELKKKCEEAINKDPKKSNKYREVITNIDKTLKAIEEYKNKAENEKFMKDVQYYITRIKNAFRLLDGNLDPWEEYKHLNDDISMLMYIYKIPSSKIIECFSKLEEDCAIIDFDLENIHGKPIDELELSKEIIKYIPEFKNNSYHNHYIFRLIAQNELESYVFVYKGKLYEFYPEDLILTPRNIDDYCESFKIDKALIEADKILGYYQLSDCPESVEKVPLPI